MGGGGDGGSKIGGGLELTDAVLTCEGHISDPQLPSKLSYLASCLQTITESDKWLVRKVEPWNSVKVTFSIPKEAAERLYLLAQAGDAALRQLGILSVQVEGDQVISLKLNGPNNEPAEIVLRADNNSSCSNEMVASTARQSTHSFAVPNIIGGQTNHKTQPTPQFRSPAVGTEGNVVGLSRQVVAHPRQVQQGFTFVESMVASQRGPHQQPVTQGIPSPVPSAPAQRVVSVATRPTFPSNPPPPYPGQDVSREATNINAANHSSLHKAGPSQVVATSPITSHIQSNTSSYRASLGHSVQPNNTVLQTGRNVVRTPMNMVKNSPLLVGLLQSPEQNSPIVKSTKISLPAPHIISRGAENSPASPSLVNVSSVTPVCNPALAVSRSSREGTPNLQHIYPVSTALPNSIANPLHAIASPKPQVLGKSNQIPMNALKTQTAADIRVSSNEGIRNLPVAGTSQERVSRGLVNCIQKEDLPSGSCSHFKKDSQYLINPNTGLLEPRPSTDSSDSEGEGKVMSPRNNCTPSDDESSNGSKKDQDVSRTKVPSHLEKMQERETSSWHNSLISSGEKIKLKLKLGREPCTQTTIIGSKKVEKRRDGAPIINNLTTLGTGEPRVPKLHIKLHSSQPVIVKSIEESSRAGPLDDAKNTKFRKKLTRNKTRDEFKFKCSKQHKDGKGSDISARFLRLSESKRLREGDHDLESVKAPKLCDDSKITISKTSRLDKSRKPRNPVRKIGDLNSLGEIASHKIMENLPPAITKVADMHTQQQSLSPTRSPLFNPTPSTRDPLGFDVQLETKDKEPISSLLAVESKDHSLAPLSSSFLSNGDVCVGAAINKVVLNPTEINSSYRDQPDGLMPVKKFLNSTVVMNKVGPSKPSYSNCVNSFRVVEDGSEKVFKKLEGFKNCEFPLLRTASDITIQSVSRSELMNLSKIEASKPKLESKVGRVLCVDVMDRKALEEALKSSRDSVKKAETSPKDPTTSMVDRLRRWNSIDNSSPVPFSSHQTSTDSTNLLSAAVKSEINSCADSESGKSVCEKNSTETSCLRQSLKVAGVNNKGDCDNSPAVNNLPVVEFSQCSEGLGIISSSNVAVEKPDEKEYLVETKNSVTSSNEDVHKEDLATSGGIVPVSNTSISTKSDGKVSEPLSAKVDADSPEGTPKGDHGNGQGGEDSGIESMDALSEKSPNRNDQSPNRREDKECDMYSIKESCDRVQLKESELCGPNKESHTEEAIDCDQSSNCLDAKEDNVIDTNVLSIEPKPDSPICTEPIVDTKITITEEASDQVEDMSVKLETTTLQSCSDSSLIPLKSEDCNNVKKIISDGSKTTTALPSSLTTVVTNLESQVSQNPNLSSGIKNPLVNSIPVSLMTTTIANSSIILQKFLTSTPSNVVTTSTESMCGEVISSIEQNNPPASSALNTKSSLLAITLTRPPGSGKINSQYAASLAKNLDAQSVDSKPSAPITESISSFESSNSATLSTATKIILATTINPTGVANSSPVNSKIMAVKPSSTTTTPINHPIGKAFRLVAMPGINAALTPVSNPVRGQIVTLKPVLAVSGPAISQSSILTKPEVQTAVPIIEKIENIANHISTTEMETDDLDFVGFSSAKKAEELKEKLIDEATIDACVPLMSPTEEEPTPMRVQPPLYTYGNKERKKESESDLEDKEKDPKVGEDVQLEEEKVIEDKVPVNKLKEETLAALTIEIPAMESMPDDKRLTRATRQSARLSSPKVNSTSGDLSPHPDKKLTSAVSTSKTNVRGSVSPALRGVKRRHESESSNASSVSEDLQDPSSKNRKRKAIARDELLKGRATKFKEAAEERDKVESSDEDIPSDQVSSVNSTSPEDGLNAFKICPGKDKEAINSRENLRRASRQKCQPEKEEPCESTDKILVKSQLPLAKVVALVKTKKESAEQPESEAVRRKTRSTAVTVAEDVPNKRRRQSKEK